MLFKASKVLLDVIAHLQVSLSPAGHLEATPGRSSGRGCSAVRTAGVMTKRQAPEAEDMIAYFTDVEGDWEYFQRYVELAEALSWTADRETLCLSEGWRFCFGGDAVDKAPGSVRCVRALVQLKKAYPDRVVLLLGNRDVNKMRLTSELAAPELASLAVPAPFWVPEARRVAPLQYVKGVAAAAEGVSADKVTERMIRKHNTRAHRLRWILKDTMGANGEFDRRRSELALLSGNPSSQITDEQVVGSYLEGVGECSGTGAGDWMRQLLELGQLAWLHRNTLFVHGGVVSCKYDASAPNGVREESCIGHVPGRATRVAVTDRAGLEKWVDDLNTWKSSVSTTCMRLKLQKRNGP